ncbi:MAG: peptidase M20, partial [Atopobium sp.]|nr:peptidase M20 [Atopobium sp.]
FKRAVAFGPYDSKAAKDLPEWVGMEHGPDEGISEEWLKRALKIYIVSIARLMQLDL